MAMLSPTKASLIKAVKQGHMTTWSGLTKDAINKHLKLTPETAMGHMNQKRQNIHYTSKVLLNYSHSRIPRYAPALMHEKIQAPREPPN
jgi:hypothetical protein